jgi:hypothetical protein
MKFKTVCSRSPTANAAISASVSPLGGRASRPYSYRLGSQLYRKPYTSAQCVRAAGDCSTRSIRCSIRFGMIRASKSLPPRLRLSRGQLLSITKRELSETRQEQCSCRPPGPWPSAFAIVRGSSQKRPIGPFSGVRFTGASWSCLHSAPSLLAQPERATTPGSRR